MRFKSMFNGEVELCPKIYWCTLNNQLVVRYPEYIRVGDLGIGGYGYKNIRKTMTYIGEL